MLYVYVVWLWYIVYAYVYLKSQAFILLICSLFPYTYFFRLMLRARGLCMALWVWRKENYCLFKLLNECQIDLIFNVSSGFVWRMDNDINLISRLCSVLLFWFVGKWIIETYRYGGIWWWNHCFQVKRCFNRFKLW